MSAINHPSHYNIPGKKECIEQMLEDYGATITYIFCLINTYKYLYRAGHKNSFREDMGKARWYCRYAEDIEEEVTFTEELKKLRNEIEGYDL